MFRPGGPPRWLRDGQKIYPTQPNSLKLACYRLINFFAKVSADSCGRRQTNQHRRKEAENCLKLLKVGQSYLKTHAKIFFYRGEIFMWNAAKMERKFIKRVLDLFCWFGTLAGLI